MINKRGLILLLTHKEHQQQLYPLESLHDSVVASDLEEVAKMLSNIQYDLLIIDDDALEEKTLNAVKELKRNFPYFPIAVLSHSSNDTYYEHLVSAGTDLLLTPNLSAEEVRQQIQIVLQQNTRYWVLKRRNRKLYLISSLPVLLREFTNTQQILMQAIKIVINLLDLEAVTLVTNSSSAYRAITVVKPLLSTDRFVESIIPKDEDNPVVWSIRHQRIQVYDDVSLNHHFTLPEGLDEHNAAIIVPFAASSAQHSALVFFIGQQSPIANEDISIYEQFVAQVDSVLLRAYQNQLQGRQLALNKSLVEAWGTFANVHSFEEAIRLLCTTIGRMNMVQNILVSYRESQTLENVLIDDSNGDLVTTFSKTEAYEAILDDLQTRHLSKRSATVVTVRKLDSVHDKHLIQLFGSNLLVLVPILVSGESFGIAVVIIARSRGLDDFDLSLLENIAQIAINTLQRITLRNVVLQNHMELMSIICSITEGVFYVDDSQRVTFYNPQITELTSVDGTDWVNQDVDYLLRAIAMASQFPMQVHSRLQSAKQQLMTNDSERDYPIVFVPLAEQNAQLRIEFVKIDNDSNKSSWMGIIHRVEQSQGPVMLERLVEQVRIGHTQLGSAINSLAEQHGRFSYGERDQLIQQIKHDTANASQRWNQFYDLYGLYFGGIFLHREAVNLNSVLERTLKDPRLAHEETLKVSSVPREIIVKVDEFHFSRALAELLAYALQVASKQTQLEFQVENHVHEIAISVSAASMSLFDELEEILANPNYVSTSEGDNLDLVIAIELVRRNGANITVQTTGSGIQQLRIIVPVTPMVPQARDENHNNHAGAVDMPVPLLEIQNSAPSREPRSIMVVAGSSTLVMQLITKLESENFSILEYENGESAVLDVNATYLDLIVVDLRVDDESGFEICQQIRKRTETPILLIADNASPQEKVRGLQVGADDFVTRPASDDELLARVRVIVNRRYLAARSSEPMRFGDLYVDFARRAVFYKNAPIELTRIEYDILYTLIVNRGQTVTHKQLLTQVWGPEYQDESQYLWVSISRLRKKLEPDPDSPRLIRTQSGVGYYFASP